MLSRRLFGGLASLLFALSSLPVAIASGVTGAYERIGPIYQTYRIAVAAWGPDQKKILPGLTEVAGTHKNGGANFLEMVNHIDKQDLDKNFFSSEDIDNDDPDPHRAAVHMFYESDIKLLQLEKVFAGENPTWPETIDKIRTVLNDAHVKMEGDGKLADIRPMRDRLDLCHVEIERFRQSDMAGGNNGQKGAAKDINKQWPGVQVIVDEVEWEHAKEFRLFAINTQQTIVASTKVKFTAEDVYKWVRDYGQHADDTNAAKKHFQVLDAHRKTMSAERARLANPSC